MIAVGLFVEEDHVMNVHNGQKGLFKGGGIYSLGVQTFACLCVMVWAAIASYILLTVRFNGYSNSNKR